MTGCRKISHCSRVKKLFHVWKADPHSQLEKHNLQFDPILVHLHSYFGWHTIKLLCSWVGLPHKNFFESHIQILLQVHKFLFQSTIFRYILKDADLICKAVLIRWAFSLNMEIRICITFETRKKYTRKNLRHKPISV